MGNAIITSRSGSNSSSGSDAIGDILQTYRTDLGDSYLLCNGDYICETENVELTRMLLNRTSLANYYKEEIQYGVKAFLVNCGDYLYKLTINSSKIQLTKFANYKKLVDGLSISTETITTSQSAYQISWAYGMDNGIYINYRNGNGTNYFIYYNISSKTVTNLNYYATDVKYAVYGNKVYQATMSTYATNTVSFSYYIGVEQTSSNITLPSNATSGHSVHDITICNNQIVVSISKSNLGYFTIAYNNLEISNTWTVNANLSKISGQPPSLIYYNNGYYFYGVPNSSGGGALYKSSTLDNTSWAAISNTTGGSTIFYTFIERDTELFLYSKDNITKHNKSGNFVSIDIDDYATYRIPRTTDLCNSSFDEILLQDCYVYYDTKSFYNWSYIIPKNEIMVQLPTIADSSRYTYVKAKE